MITTEEDILREYHGNKPFSLGGAWRVYKAAPKIPRSRIDKALQKSEIYTKYKQPKKQKFFSPIYVRGFRHIWQADLAVFRHKDLKAANYPFQYMLIVIDCWTRRIWLEPMVSKECEETIEKFDKVFKSVKVLPLMIQTDQGGEFKCKLADRYFDNKKIFTYWSRTKRKCAFVERVIQTIKNIFEKKMERNNNKQWVSLIPEVLDTYMNTKHTSIKMTPNEAEESKNQRKLHIIHNRKYKIAESKRQHPKFKEGDTVRLKKDTSVFKRSWHKKWSDTIFTIGKVLTRQVVPRYVLIDPRDNKAMSGHPVEADLLRVRV